VTGNQDNPGSPASYAAVTTPAHLAGVCPRCGATLSPASTSCGRCGSATTGNKPAEQAERIRLRLQESVGDSYRLLEMLGRGGMGIVFRAHEQALDREVALKVLALDPVLSPDAFGRFEREARLAARLDHPNIVPIFAVGQRQTVAFYTMRLVRGGTLEEMIEGHVALGFEHTLDILRDVARALDYAHGQGVIHRDIKPANVLIGDSGHAMVSDFGIATALGVEGPSGSGTGIVGSPGYMPPEQWRGEEIDARGDQYALGVMAFELLTGHRPFETVRVQDLMRLHLSAPVPSAAAVRAGLNPLVDAAIRRAMAKHPAERFGTSTAFIESLAGRRPATATRSSMQIVAPPTPSSARSGWSTLAVAVVAAVAIAAGVVFFRRESGAAGVASPAAAARALVAAAPPASPTRIGASATSPVAPTAASAAVASDTILAPGDTTFDVNADSRPTSARRRPVAVDTAAFGPMRESDSRDGPAYIRVAVRGGAGKVRIDGHTLGFTPLVVRVDPGPHLVSLESGGDAFLPAQLTVNAVAADTVAALFAAQVKRAGEDSDNSPK
jgi:serine/threonine-protein kinase